MVVAVKFSKEITLSRMVAMGLVCGLLACADTLRAQQSQSHSLGGISFGNADHSAHVAQERTLHGTVVDKSGAAVPGAMVYLKQGDKGPVSVSVADAKGSYRFGPLSSETDYQVWAKVDGKISPSKVVSSFNTNAEIVMSLQVP